MKFCGLLLLTFGGFRRFLFCLFMELIYIWWMNGIFIKILSWGSSCFDPEMNIDGPCMCKPNWKLKVSALQAHLSHSWPANYPVLMRPLST